MNRPRPFNLFLVASGLLLTILILLPILALLGAGSDIGLLQLLVQPEVLQALWVTALSSGLALPLIFLLGLPSAYGLSRCHGRLRRGLEILLELPMVMPPVVAGLALLLTFGRRGLFGDLFAELGLRIPFTLGAVVLAIVFVITPFFVRRCVVLFDSVERRLEDAALLLGATPLQTFWHVTLPVIRRGLFAEGVMSLAQGIGLFGVIILFAGNLPGRTQTLSLSIYSAFESDPQQAFGLAALLLMISLLLLAFVHLLAPEKSNQ